MKNKYQKRSEGREEERKEEGSLKSKRKKREEGLEERKAT